MAIPDNILKALGNPGIWAYVKKEHYEAAIKFLDEKMNQFHDKERGELEVLFKDFQYKESIVACDFSREKFLDEDIVIGIWRVDKKYQKNG